MTISPYWQAVQWLSTAGFIIGTIMMLSPVVASTSITPWVVYFTANVVWMIDSIIRKNTPYIALSLFFCAWDALLVASRMGGDVLIHMLPLTIILERLP